MRDSVRLLWCVGAEFFVPPRTVSLLSLSSTSPLLCSLRPGASHHVVLGAGHRSAQQDRSIHYIPGRAQQQPQPSRRAVAHLERWAGVWRGLEHHGLVADHVLRGGAVHVVVTILPQLEDVPKASEC